MTRRHTDDGPNARFLLEYLDFKPRYKMKQGDNYTYSPLLHHLTEEIEQVHQDSYLDYEEDDDDETNNNKLSNNVPPSIIDSEEDDTQTTPLHANMSDVLNLPNTNIHQNRSLLSDVWNSFTYRHQRLILLLFLSILFAGFFFFPIFIQ